MLSAVSHSGSVRAQRTARSSFKAIILVWSALISGAVSNRAPVCVVTDPLHDFRYFIQLIDLHVSTTALFILYKDRLHVSTIRVVILRSLISFKS